MVGFPTKKPALLLMRDPLECIQHILSLECFKFDLEFKPHTIWENDMRKVRQYSEMWTGRWWQATQVKHFKALTCLKTNTPKG